MQTPTLLSSERSRRGTICLHDNVSSWFDGLAPERFSCTYMTHAGGGIAGIENAFLQQSEKGEIEA